MSERLRAHGAMPIEVPTISVEPPRSPAQMERAVKGLVDGRYQWVVFTSTNAVRAVWEKFEELGLDARAFSGVKIACIGEATADKVRELGILPELLPSGDQSSEGTAGRLPAARRHTGPGGPGAAAAGGPSPSRPWRPVCVTVAGRSTTSRPTGPCVRLRHRPRPAR
jgi:uroporphyrinogen III methyltransferase/synthase